MEAITRDGEKAPSSENVCMFGGKLVVVAMMVVVMISDVRVM